LETHTKGKMMNKEELIEEIEIFEKLDVKYLLEELEKNSSLDFSKTTQEPLELNNEVSELIIESLVLLVKKDEKFSFEIQKAILEVNKRNKVADIAIAELFIGTGIGFLLGLLMKKNSVNVYGAMQNDGDIDYHLHLDNVSQEDLKGIINNYLDDSNES
jgi:hypothetical protein